MRRVAGAIVAVLLLAGCAQIPTSGPIHEGVEVQVENEESFLRLIPRPPRDGMTQLEIVRGFLEASASFDRNHEIARKYLTDTADDSWRPESGTTVYDADAMVLGLQGGITPPNTVAVLVAPQLATISARGEYLSAPTDALTTAGFRLAKVNGEWRIAEVPPGLLLTDQDVSRAYRPFALYYLDPAGVVVVPDQSMQPISRQGVTDALVAALLQGPSEWLAPAVRTGFPAGTELARPIRVSSGVAQVELSNAVLAASQEDRRALSAQLVWTLTQLGEVGAVRITVEGSPLAIDEVPQVQSPELWQRYDPDLLPIDSVGYVSQAGILMALRAGLIPVPGPLGDGRQRLRFYAVNRSSELVAGLSEDRSTLYAGQLGASALSPVLSAGNLTPPSWDRAGMIWTVNRGPDRSRVWVVVPGRGPTQVLAPELAGLHVARLRVASDGVRALVVTGTPGVDGQLWLARIQRTSNTLTLDGLRLVSARLTEVRDADWARSTSIAVLGRDSGGVLEPMLVSAPGGQVTRLSGALPGALSIAGAPGLPVLVGTDENLILENSETGWRDVGSGTDPAYPG